MTCRLKWWFNRMPINAEQDELYRELARRSEKLARIYRGGLLVLDQAENPCRFELAAQSFRELIEKGSLLTAEQRFKTGDTVANRIVRVRNAFQAVKRTPEADAVADVTANAVPLRKLLLELEQFFEWHQKNRPNAQVDAEWLLKTLTGPGPAVPIDTFSAEVKGWIDAEDYFTKTAHNRTDTVDHGTLVITSPRWRRFFAGGSALVLWPNWTQSTPC